MLYVAESNGESIISFKVKENETLPNGEKEKIAFITENNYVFFKFVIELLWSTCI